VEPDMKTWKLGFRTKYFCKKNWSRHLNSD